MKDLVGRIRATPILAVPAVCLAIVLAMNARTGYALADSSLMFAGVFVALGVGTAYAADVGLAMRGWTPRRVALVGWLVVGLVVDQWCGWMTAGVLFGDGAAARTRQVESLDTARESIRAKKAERERLGTPRSIAAIEADERLECTIKSKTYADGVGPKCTKLRAELGDARKAAALDAEVPALQAALDKRKAVAAGAAEYTVPMKLGAAAGYDLKADDLRFWVEMALIAVLGFWANLGWWVLSPAAARETAAHKRVDDPDFWGPRRLASPERMAPLPPQPAPLVPVAAEVKPASSPDPVAAAAEAAAPQPVALIAPGALPQPSPEASAAPVVRAPMQANLDRVATFKAAALEDADGQLLPLAWAHRAYVVWAKGRAVTPAAFQALLEASGSSLSTLNGVVHLVGVRLRDGAAAAAEA